MNRVTANIPDLHRNLQRLARAALGEGLKSLFNDVEKRLFNRAEQSIDDASRQDFFDAVASLKQKRQLFQQNMLETLEQAELPKKVPNKGWNTLVKDHNLAMQIEDMIGQAKARFGIEHAQYEARITWMNQQAPESLPAGIYTLQNLTTAFILNLDLFPESAREDLIRAVGNHLLNKLEPLYVLLNDYLIQAGILARIRSVRTPSGGNVGEKDNDIQEVLAALDVVEPNVLSGADLHSAIYKMTDKGKRTAIVDQIDGWKPLLLLETIMAHLRQSGENGRIDPEELESIKLVGLLFSTIMNDQKVRLSVRQKILGLQWPTVSVALRERGFFRNASHPARDVPNLCALIGSDPSASNQALIELGRIIDRLVINHENDTKAFDQARDELKQLGQGEIPAAEEIEAQQTETPSHDEMLQRCQQRVSDTINTRVAEQALTGMRILPETRDFIGRIIDPVMVVALINFGRNSQPWQKALDILDEALTLQSGTDPHDARRHTAFHKKVWDLLELVDQGTPQMQDQLDEFVTAMTRQVAPETSLRTSRRTFAPETVMANDAPVAQDCSDDTATPVESIADTEATPEADARSQATVDDVPAETTADPLPQEVLEIAAEAPETPASDSDQEATSAEPEAIEADQPAEPEVSADEATAEQIEAEQTAHLLNHRDVMVFIQTYLMSNEWFQVYTGSGNALRRLKGKDINTALGVVNFANRTGELELFVPLSQLVQDLLDQRTRPVFENPTYNRALAELRGQLDSEAARDE